MASETVESEDLIYQVTLTSGETRGRRPVGVTDKVWTGTEVVLNPPPNPPTTRAFRPAHIDKASSGGLKFVDPVINLRASDGRLTYGYGLICYDFRADNAERTDVSGRPNKSMKDVERVLSATLKFQVSTIAGSNAAFYIACLPKVNLTRGPIPAIGELGMNYFLGYNEIYTDPRGRPITSRHGGSGNINPACIAGSSVNREGAVMPIVLRSTDSFPVMITVDLRPRMLTALQTAMMRRTVFGLAVVPVQGFDSGHNPFQPDQGLAFWDGTLRVGRDITNGVKVRSGLERGFVPPMLEYKYALNDRRRSEGAGSARATESGFMADDIFASTNSGFGS